MNELYSFINDDPRVDRPSTPMNYEIFVNRHQCSLPKSFVENNSILDLGCCLGATGSWVLTNGATHYTGVEIQKKLSILAEEKLSKYYDKDKFTIINESISNFLANNNQEYDIVVLFGSLYSFINIFEILENISKIAKRAIVIDSLHPLNEENNDIAIMNLVPEQAMNSSEIGYFYRGLGTRINPKFLNLLMQYYGFKNIEGPLIPKLHTDQTIRNSYTTAELTKDKNDIRFIMRFLKSSTISSLEDILKTNNKTFKYNEIDEDEIIESNKKWEFNSEVAMNFENEALKNIPDYQRVIDLSYDIINNSSIDKDSYIIDIGSALGKTVDKFISNNYKNTYGVENSSYMIEKSLHKDKIFFDNQLPLKNWDVIIANWTLHFIHDQEEYLKTIYTQLNTNGYFIFSNKILTNSLIEKLYYNFKKENGLSEEYIKDKKKKLKGILIEKPLEWYIRVLNQIGFKDIEIVNSRFMFITFMCRKF